MKYPNITAVPNDGNAFAILGAVGKALKRAGVDKAEVDAFYAEATAGDYEHLKATARKWVNAELED